MKKGKNEIEHKTEHPEVSIMANEITDPLGSWTGVPKDPYEKPVQDADDL